MSFVQKWNTASSKVMLWGAGSTLLFAKMAVTELRAPPHMCWNWWRRRALGSYIEWDILTVSSFQSTCIAEQKIKDWKVSVYDTATKCGTGHVDEKSAAFNVNAPCTPRIDIMTSHGILELQSTTIWMAPPSLMSRSFYALAAPNFLSPWPSASKL